MCFIVSGQKNEEKKCLLQTEYRMALIKQMTGEVDVGAPGSGRRLPVSLEYQRLFGRHFPCKIVAESQKNRISRSCKVCVLAEREIDRVMLRRNVSGVNLRVAMNVPNVW